MQSRSIVRSYSGRLLWLTGLSAPNPASEFLSARILCVSSSLSLLALIALIVQLSGGWYFGVSLFGTFVIPLLGWCGINCSSRALILCFCIANMIMFSVFTATTLPFILSLYRSFGSSAGLWIYTVFSCFLLALHVLGAGYGIQALCHPLFLQTLEQKVLQPVAPEDAFLYLGHGETKASVVYTAPLPNAGKAPGSPGASAPLRVKREVPSQPNLASSVV
jgi:hypothetical protein